MFFSILTLENNNYVTPTSNMKLKQNGGRVVCIMWLWWFFVRCVSNWPRAQSDFIAFIFKYTYTATRIIINQLLIKCTITRTITFPQLYSVRSNQRKVMSFVTAEKEEEEKKKKTSPTASSTNIHGEEPPKAHKLYRTLIISSSCAVGGLRLPSLSITSVLHTETNVVYL